MATLISKETADLKLAREQIVYWRTHLDVFIIKRFGVMLHDTQRVVARSIGNCIDSNIVKSRGYGKTWLIALCALALGCL